MKTSSANFFSLADLTVGQHGCIRLLNCAPDMQRRLLHMGFVPNTNIVCVGSSSHGDPRAYYLRGCIIALRNKDSQNIFLQEVTNLDPSK